jgi:hypothetical protein
MGTTKTPRPVKLFVGLISGKSLLFEKAAEHLVGLFGPLQTSSSLYRWTHTDHYQKELGADLKRQFLFFKERISPERLADIKEQTNGLEKQWAVSKPSGPARQINLDPGYITPAKVVMATTKDFAHRIYLSKGIYAEVTLIYRGRSFEPLPYTYPDFRTKEYLELFNGVRSSDMKEETEY